MAQEFAEMWSADAEASGLGSATVAPPERGGVFLPDVVESVLIALAVNAASQVLYDVVKRLVTGARPRVEASELEVEVSDKPGSGDRVVVVRSRQVRS